MNRERAGLAVAPEVQAELFRSRTLGGQAERLEDADFGSQPSAPQGPMAMGPQPGPRLGGGGGGGDGGSDDERKTKIAAKKAAKAAARKSSKAAAKEAARLAEDREVNTAREFLVIVVYCLHFSKQSRKSQL